MTSDNRRYLIIGGSAAGMAAAQTIRAHDPGGSIQVLSDEADAPYFRPLIPFLISRKKTVREMQLAGQGPYQAEGIDLRLQIRAVGIDPAVQNVLTADHQTFSYDRLLIATGSRPYIPPEIKDNRPEGVFALRTIEDARRAARRVEVSDSAVMLGGGLLNLKAAFALLERGIKVTLVVFSPEVLSQLMEPADADLIRKALDDAGLRIITGRSATEIISDASGVTAVVLDDGSEIPCQMVCIGKGVQPNSGWLNNDDIEVDGGVVVDTFTRTGSPNIHAAGDVAVTFDPITGDRMVTGLWTNAVEMGRCAGANMAGRSTAYSGTFGILNATQVANMPFVSMGIVHTGGTNYETHVTAKNGSYRKVVFSPQGHRLLGALFVGDIAGAGLYRLVIRERMKMNGLKKYVIDHSLHYGHLLLAKKQS